MREVEASASLVMNAPAKIPYAILADYRAGHPSVLPQRAFLSLDVEQGGTGAGTVFRIRMKSFGATRVLRGRVTEPIPGQVLAEKYDGTDMETTFEVLPGADLRSSRVTIRTRWKVRGLRGWVEAMLAPGFLRGLYAEELQNLKRAAEGQAAGGRPA